MNEGTNPAPLVGHQQAKNATAVDKNEGGIHYHNYAAATPEPGDPSNFPSAGVSRNDDFVGRTRELDDLHAALVGGEDVAVFHAVSGDGGFGKSQLAVEYAYLHGPFERGSKH
ncbi:MAG: hypothetical protein AAGI46_03575 [Planctomycetota bacterium]